jgi:hypothetical protein
MSNGDKELKEKLQKLIQDSIRVDEELRNKYQIGDKFRFIRDSLHAQATRIQEELDALAVEIESKTDKIAEDEMLVYVYIFNAQGLVLQTWQKMLNPSVFYEYSVNRPAYSEKAHIESFIRSRTSKAQHGFLTIVVKKTDVLPVQAGLEAAVDSIGNPLIKIKEGSLKFNKMFSFTHQENEYVVNKDGQIVKKDQV